MKTLKILKYVLCMGLFLNVSQVWAQKLEINTGYYSLSATNSTGTKASVTSFTSYRVGYRHPVRTKWELTAGYTVILASDLAYGFDFGADYFYLTRANPIKAQSENVTLNLKEVFRPYVGLTFTQRQFQELSSQLAGFGVRFGFEYDTSWKFLASRGISLKGEVRFCALDGTGKTQGDELFAGMGIVYHF